MVGSREKIESARLEIQKAMVDDVVDAKQIKLSDEQVSEFLEVKSILADLTSIKERLKECLDAQLFTYGAYESSCGIKAQNINFLAGKFGQDAERLPLKEFLNNVARVGLVNIRKETVELQAMRKELDIMYSKLPSLGSFYAELSKINNYINRQEDKYEKTELKEAADSEQDSFPDSLFTNEELVQLIKYVAHMMKKNNFDSSRWPEIFLNCLVRMIEKGYKLNASLLNNIQKKYDAINMEGPKRSEDCAKVLRLHELCSKIVAAKARLGKFEVQAKIDALKKSGKPGNLPDADVNAHSPPISHASSSIQLSQEQKASPANNSSQPNSVKKSAISNVGQFKLPDVPSLENMREAVLCFQRQLIHSLDLKIEFLNERIEQLDFIVEFLSSDEEQRGALIKARASKEHHPFWAAQFQPAGSVSKPMPIPAPQQAAKAGAQARRA